MAVDILQRHPCRSGRWSIGIWPVRTRPAACPSLRNRVRIRGGRAVDLGVALSRGTRALALMFHLGANILSGTIRFAPFALREIHTRLFKVATGVGLMTFLGWRVSQPYLFETSIFPASAGWVGLALLALSVVLTVSALFSTEQ